MNSPISLGADRASSTARVKKKRTLFVDFPILANGARYDFHELFRNLGLKRARSRSDSYQIAAMEEEDDVSAVIANTRTQARARER